MTLHVWQLKPSYLCEVSWSNLVWLLSYACRIKQKGEGEEEEEDDDNGDDEGATQPVVLGV